jgi:hypothetical protein
MRHAFAFGEAAAALLGALADADDGVALALFGVSSFSVQ